MKSLGLNNKKLTVEFTDGQLLYISKVYGHVTGSNCDPTKLNQKHIQLVFDWLSTNKI